MEKLSSGNIERQKKILLRRQPAQGWYSGGDAPCISENCPIFSFPIRTTLGCPAAWVATSQVSSLMDAILFFQWWVSQRITSRWQTWQITKRLHVLPSAEISSGSSAGYSLFIEDQLQFPPAKFILLVWVCSRNAQLWATSNANPPTGSHPETPSTRAASAGVAWTRSGLCKLPAGSSNHWLILPCPHCWNWGQSTGYTSGQLAELKCSADWNGWLLTTFSITVGSPPFSDLHPPSAGLCQWSQPSFQALVKYIFIQDFFFFSPLGQLRRQQRREGKYSSFTYLKCIRCDAPGAAPAMPE